MPDDPVPSPTPSDETLSVKPATPSPLGPEALRGYAILGCYFTGIVGILVGLFTGSGLALLASAAAFGVVFYRSVP